MAGDIYLYLDGIPGESTNVHLTNWIDVLSFSVGVDMEVNQEGRSGASGGVTSGQADPADITIDTKMSVASPVLLECCASGAVIPRGRLIQCNVVAGKRLVVSEYAFGDSIISSVSLSASGGAIPDESISINYGSIIWHYNCFNHFNPVVWVGDAHREWSVIKAKVGEIGSQDNAHKAFDMQISSKGVMPDVKYDEDKHNRREGIYSYNSFFLSNSDNINFKPGPVYFHDADAETKQERFDKKNS